MWTKHSWAGGLAMALMMTGGGAQAARPLAVVELFTSQGCSSCPPTEANFIGLADQPGVLALSFGVTYWNDLGWTDTFAQPKFTQRQAAYERPLGHAGPFTPQVVVNGRVDTVGARKGEIEAVISRQTLAGGPTLKIAKGLVALGAGPARARGADVWLVRYDPHVIQTPIKAGENDGRTLPQKNVVRDLIRLGAWTGAPARFLVPKAGMGLATAILVQAPDGGPILAAVRG